MEKRWLNDKKMLTAFKKGTRELKETGELNILVKYDCEIITCETRIKVENSVEGSDRGEENQTEIVICER